MAATTIRCIAAVAGILGLLATSCGDGPAEPDQSAEAAAPTQPTEPEIPPTTTRPGTPDKTQDPEPETPTPTEAPAPDTTSTTQPPAPDTTPPDTTTTTQPPAPDTTPPDTTTTTQPPAPDTTPPDTTTTTQPPAPDTTSTLVGQERERDTSPAASPEAIAQVVQGTNEFAVEFFKAVADPAANAVIGNYSLSTALLLAMAGTAGDTTDAFGRLLNVESLEGDELHPAVNAVDLALESRAGEGVRLSTANSLFVQDGLQMRDEFLDTAVRDYGAPVRIVDFRRSGDEAAAAVNDWVAEETEGFIDRIADGFAEETVVVVANAMYLKASWAVVFERVETLGVFTLADGTTVETEYMSHDDSLPLVRGSDFVAVELPYEGDELGLVIIQPADLAAFESKMSAGQLREIAKGLRNRDVDFRVPVWSTRSELDALDPLHRLGLPQRYDFGTMVDPAELARFGGDGLTIDEMLHVARIEVDEKGTTAAAATSIGIGVTSISEPEVVNIDSPFLYFIRDRYSGAILFIGHVADPTITAGQ